MRRPTPLALSMGDPAGIGPEIALKAWAALRAGGPAFTLYGDREVFARAAALISAPAPVVVESADEAAARFPAAPPVRGAASNASDPSGQGAVIAAIEQGVAACLAGEASGLVTAPVSKAKLYAAGFSFPGHTEYLAHLTADAPMTGPRGPAMMLAAPELKTVLVSVHLSLREAIAALTSERIIETGRLAAFALAQDFGIATPRLAVAGLNPHAGEGGALGREEIEIIAPAIDRLRAEGIDAVGPLPPDTMFHAEARAGYDAAVCLYHDQGLIPVKTLNFHGGVNTTLGLPIVRASPDHGTAEDIAWTGTARAESLIAAIRLAAEIAGRRRAYARAA